jgi:hypothetical protein
MNFIKKVFDKVKDSSVHIQFQKFSKGEFRNKAIIKAKVQSGGKYTLWTSAEFANDLVRAVAEKVGNEKVSVAGAIVSTSDLKDRLDFKDIKQFQGVKRYLIDKEMTGDEIIALLEEFPKTFFALSFATDKDDTKLKIKPKAPKSGKPGKGKEEGPKADFCNLKTKDAELAKSFVFEKPDFKDAEIKHTFFIEQLIIPDELKSSKDFAKIREEAVRKGRIVREGKIDSQEVKKEFEFEA